MVKNCLLDGCKIAVEQYLGQHLLSGDSQPCSQGKSEPQLKAGDQLLTALGASVLGKAIVIAALHQTQVTPSSFCKAHASLTV